MWKKSFEVNCLKLRIKDTWSMNLVYLGMGNWIKLKITQCHKWGYFRSKPRVWFFYMICRMDTRLSVGYIVKSCDRTVPCLSINGWYCKTTTWPGMLYGIECCLLGKRYNHCVWVFFVWNGYYSLKGTRCAPTKCFKERKQNKEDKSEWTNIRRNKATNQTHGKKSKARNPQLSQPNTLLPSSRNIRNRRALIFCPSRR